VLWCRCLSIEAPPPEEKLATLSDIAQEHGVEWDAHGAASDMLPSGAPSGYGQACLHMPCHSQAMHIMTSTAVASLFCLDLTQVSCDGRL